MKQQPNDEPTNTSRVSFFSWRERFCRFSRLDFYECELRVNKRASKFISWEDSNRWLLNFFYIQKSGRVLVLLFSLSLFSFSRLHGLLFLVSCHEIVLYSCVSCSSLPFFSWPFFLIHNLFRSPLPCAHLSIRGRKRKILTSQTERQTRMSWLIQPVLQQKKQQFKLPQKWHRCLSSYIV